MAKPSTLEEALAELQKIAVFLECEHPYGCGGDVLSLVKAKIGVLNSQRFYYENLVRKLESAANLKEKT